ncbi:MAG: hypothetical protein AAGF31_07465 [Planctomycetota bacterium]
MPEKTSGKTVKVRLRHQSNHPDCQGKPGQVVDAPEALAKRWLDNGGATSEEKESGK